MTRGAIAVVVIAAGAALVPVPAGLVERWYSSLLFPAIQRVLTPLSNAVPFAIFDVLCVSALCVFALAAYRSVRRLGWRRGGLRLAALTITSASIVYLVFLGTWGLNYRRVPLTEKFDFDPGRIDGRAARDFGASNLEALNRFHAAAHASRLSLDTLASSFETTIRRLGATSGIAPGRPKETIFGGYFHEITVAGMTDPFFLETLLAPDLFEIERPFTIAHEWAHLAGYADESEANFVAWLTCRHGDALAQYSAAFAMAWYVPMPDLPDAGPQADMWAVQLRYRKTSPRVREAAMRGYDGFLKANRVGKGIESYDAVVELILATAVDDAGYPRRR